MGIEPDLMRDDGSFWKACSGHSGFAIRAMCDDGAPQFYLRRVERNDDRKWWCPWRPKWRLLPEFWVGSELSGAGFGTKWKAD